MRCMDISGPIRTALQRFVIPIPPTTVGDPIALFLQLVAVDSHPPMGVPAYLAEGGKAMKELPNPAVLLAMACTVRTIPRIGRLHREPMAVALRPVFEGVIQAAEKSIMSRETTPADFLWFFYLLVLAKERLAMSVPEMLLKGTWRRGWGGQNAEGFLHPRGSNAEEASRRDLAALHASYNAVIALREFERLEPIEKLVQWHVKNTPADVSPAEPWALAAFAALDETDYAVRKTAAAISRLENASENDALLSLCLLADGLVTQEEVSHL
jgi:hypothetical protein